MPSYTALNNTRTEEKPAKIHAWGSLGTISVWVLAGGTVSIFASTALLIFLWHGATLQYPEIRGDPTPLWRNIAVNDWATRSVTVCAAVIRLAISAQAGIVMSMVGSLLLERCQVELQDAAFFTMIRALQVQPTSVLFHKGGAVLRSSMLCSLLLIAAAITAAISTFTSTILLADFSRIPIVGPVNLQNISYNSRMTGLYKPDLWRSPIVAYPRFAEWTDDPEPPLNGSRIDDTGRRLIAMLPFTSVSGRETLRSYDGIASVFDTRFTCFQPNITLRSLNYSYDREPDSRSFRRRLAVSASFDFKGDPEVETVLDAYGTLIINQTRDWFSCALPTDHPGQSQNYSVCSFSYAGRPIYSSDKAGGIHIFTHLLFHVVRPPSNGGWDQVDYPQYLSRPYLEGVNSAPILPSNVSITTPASGIWKTIEFISDTPLKGLTLNITVCINPAANGETQRIKATSPVDGLEPTLAWLSQRVPYDNSLGSSYYSYYNTTPLLRQLGISSSSTGTPLSPVERGIMTLHAPTPLSRYPNETFQKLDLTAFLPQFQLLTANPPNTTEADGIILTLHQNFTQSTAIMSLGDPSRFEQPLSIGNPLHASLFAAAVRETGSVARAMQAWYTVLLAQREQDWLRRATQVVEANVTVSVEVSVPVRWAGFGIVMGVLVVHLVVVGVVRVWFVREARFSLLGECWAAVAQVNSSATRDLLEGVTAVSDREVEGMVKGKQGGRRRRMGYRVVEVEDTRRRELVSVAR